MDPKLPTRSANALIGAVGLPAAGMFDFIGAHDAEVFISAAGSRADRRRPIET